MSIAYYSTERSRKSLLIVTGLVVLLYNVSCKKFLEVDEPNSKISNEKVFSNDGNANSAVVGIYIEMYNGVFGHGGIGSLPWLAGLSADELKNNPQTDLNVVAFERNQIVADNPHVLNNWSSIYKAIYQANAVVEGLALSTGVTSSIKDQLRGEALFVRAFSYFYLTNFYGDVPLLLATDYQVNARHNRSSLAQVYSRIEQDLLDAERLLPENYPTEQRVRPNKTAAAALLSRYYLYQRNWGKAEEYATKVIKKTDYYELSSDLNTVFLATSKEAIWQLKPFDIANSTREGTAFGPYEGPLNNVLNPDLVMKFTSEDKRRINWIKSTQANGKTIYLPYKYKLSQASGPLTTEYSMVFRLAEQFLIRAEARANLGRITGDDSAVSDINIIRSRAGLNEISVSSLPEIINVLETERLLELFSESGHRWMDLKRWGKATEVLSPIKTNWSTDDVLYPIPESEINKNPNLKPQNKGY